MAYISNKPISLSFNRGTLLLAGVGCEQLPEIFGPSVWAWDNRVGALRCDAIHYAVIRAALAEQFGPLLSDEVPNPCGVYWPKVKLPKLRSNQIEALEAWSKADCRGQVIMPTGTGKTEVALAATGRKLRHWSSHPFAI